MGLVVVEVGIPKTLLQHALTFSPGRGGFGQRDNGPPDAVLGKKHNTHKPGSIANMETEIGEFQHAVEGYAFQSFHLCSFKHSSRSIKHWQY